MAAQAAKPLETEPVDEESGRHRRQPVRRWARVLFRTVVTVEAGLLLAQAGLAGGFLSGHYAALDMHALNAKFIIITGALVLISAVLLWRPGRGPGWPAAVCGVILVAEEVQIIMGFSRVIAVHVPLGVSIIAAVALMLAWAWRPTGAGDEVTA
jgi:hypothetical protein